MAEFEKLLQDADKVIAASTQRIDDTMRQIGQGADPGTLENEVRTLFQQVAEGLATIAQRNR
jgi:hypothetical protein